MPFLKLPRLWQVGEQVKEVGEYGQLFVHLMRLMTEQLLIA